MFPVAVQTKYWFWIFEISEFKSLCLGNFHMPLITNVKCRLSQERLAVGRKLRLRDTYIGYL